MYEMFCVGGGELGGGCGWVDITLNQLKKCREYRKFSVVF